jgi:hypothetical protein
MNFFKLSIYSILIISTLLVSCTKDEPVIEPTKLDKDITTDMILTNINPDPSAIDYIVSKENLNVTAKLIIEPGVTIAFEANTGLYLPYTGKGSIISKGTTSLPIVFTGMTKTPGFWNGILIATADTNNAFEQCTFEYAGGKGLFGSGNPLCNVLIAKVATVIGKVNIRNCTFQHSKGMGLCVTKEAELLSFESNAFISNELAPMQVPPSEVDMINSTSSFSNGNGYNGVEIIGQNLEQLAEVKWNKLSNASSYKILGSITVLSGLDIQPGAIFDMETGVLFRATFPKGYIKAVGTGTDKITFKGVNAGKGSWKGILFTTSDLNNELSHCIISGAGGGSLITGLSLANIGVFTQSGNVGKLKINNCTIENGAGCGLSIGANTAVVQSGNTFLNLTGGDVCN